ncbi:hypothetical protein KW784_01165 [Candidatus Parcubacteria bacterium]|nr:hypothetical protein [Candidatus Parcubacteria bacterium]
MPRVLALGRERHAINHGHDRAADGGRIDVEVALEEVHGLGVLDALRLGRAEKERPTLGRGQEREGTEAQSEEDEGEIVRASGLGSGEPDIGVAKLINACLRHGNGSVEPLFGKLSVGTY